MRTDYTSGFNTSRNSKANAPVNLLKIEWPAMNGLPALTLRLADREGIVINSVIWYPLINDMGDLDRLVSPDQADSNSLPNLTASVVNAPVDLFSDPDYPIKAISNVRVGGHLADSGDFSIDVVNGEVVFSSKPKKSDSIDTKFLQAQNDVVGAGNSAINPTNANIPNSPTTYAKINQSAAVLSLRQTNSLANIGTIGKVLLRVEHFVEEKLPNDSMTAHVTGVGQVGTLSAPAADDVVVSSGTTDITHTHLDSLGFPISDPQHQHSEALPPKITQNALSGVGGQTIGLSNGEQHIITFPDPGPGTWATAEYGFGFEWSGTINGPSTVDVYANNYGGSPSAGYRLWRRQGTTETYTTGGNINTDTNSIRITHNATLIVFKIISATRVVTMTAPLQVSTQATSVSTSKTGSLTQHSSSPGINSTAEKATRSVVDFFDITSHVNGDWNWFTNRESKVQYNGSSDGRTAFIVHLAYEIEYARRRIQFTDEVNADIQGVKDDSIGTLTGTANALVERPDHVYKWSILKALNLASSVLDPISLVEAGGLFSGYLLAGVISNKISVRELWNQWGKESRSFFYWDLGLAKILFRQLNLVNTSTIPAKTILDNMVLLDSQNRIRFKSLRTPIEDVVNKIDLRYRKNWSSEGYKSVESGEDAESINQFGKKEKPIDFEFNWIRSQTAAEDLVSFYLQERGLPRDIYEIELLLDNMEIERGDILEVNPPTHELENVKVMVLGAGRSIGSGSGNRMDSVPIIVRQMRGFVGNTGFGLQAFGGSGFGGAEIN